MSLVSDRRDDDGGVDGLEVYGVWWKGTEGGAEYDGPGTITGRKRVRKVGKGRSDAGRCGPCAPAAESQRATGSKKSVALNPRLEEKYAIQG